MNKSQATPIFTVRKASVYEPQNKYLTGLMFPNLIVYADSVQFDIYKDSVFIYI